jgi:hypothetical protein
LSSSKIPVVSGAYNALLDTVIHKKTGLLGKNITDLERNIIFLLSNPQISKKMGIEGKKYVKKKFSFKVIAPKWIKIINAVIFNKPIEKPKSKIKNIFRHLKFLRVINSYMSFLIPMKWPSIYHLEKKLWPLKNWFFRKL